MPRFGVGCPLDASDSNEEADALSRGDTTGFDSSLRVDIDLEAVQWRVLDQVLRWGAELEEGRSEYKSPEAVAARRAAPAQPRIKKRKGERLRDREKW